MVDCARTVMYVDIQIVALENNIHFFWSAKENEPKKTDPPLNV